MFWSFFFLFMVLRQPIVAAFGKDVVIMANVWVTTLDNPFDPFDDFDNWYRFDEDHGYHTCAYVARLAETSHGLSDQEYEDRVNEAVNEIVEYNVLGIYKKVVENNQDTPVEGENEA